MTIQTGKAHVRIALIDPEGSTLLNVPIPISNEEWAKYYLYGLPPDTAEFDGELWRERMRQEDLRNAWLFDTALKLRGLLKRAIKSQDGRSVTTELMKGTISNDAEQ